TREARWLRRELGERRPAPRHRRPDRIRRPLRAVPLPPRVAAVDPLHAAGGIGRSSVDVAFVSGCRARPRGAGNRRRALTLPSSADPGRDAVASPRRPDPVLVTAVVGSYSMPGWLERVKNDYLQRRISRHDLDEIHDAAVKAAIKDQEAAGIDVVSDGERRRGNTIWH